MNTKAIILAGGLGTRLAEETELKPKPMIEIGGKPILWHIMKTYSLYGINDFIICLGYKGEVIKDYFNNYLNNFSSYSISLVTGEKRFLESSSEGWNITFLETGLETQIGGRIKKAINLVKDDPYFLLTYGDGLADIDIASSIKQHTELGKLATITAVQPPGRFGALSINSHSKLVERFLEKPSGDGGWINGGYFVLNPKIQEYINDDPLTIWEEGPLENIAKDGQLCAFYHRGFWHPMDTLRDKRILTNLWDKKKAPWKKW
jgi:glucose-1-phosphate cytidylyltransferase